MTQPEVIWRAANGAPIACRDSLRVLHDNADELRGVMQDMFDDAILIGVTDADMREHLRAMVADLVSPKQ